MHTSQCCCTVGCTRHTVVISSKSKRSCNIAPWFSANHVGFASRVFASRFDDCDLAGKRWHCPRETEGERDWGSVAIAAAAASAAAEAAIARMGLRGRSLVARCPGRSALDRPNITALSVEMAINWFAISPPSARRRRRRRRRRLRASRVPALRRHACPALSVPCTPAPPSACTTVIAECIAPTLHGNSVSDRLRRARKSIPRLTDSLTRFG